MSATVYASARYGASAETSATGLHVGTLTFNYTSEQAYAPNHIGCDVGISIYNDKADVSLDGVVAVKGTGATGDIAAAVSLANTTADSLNLLSDRSPTTPVANASLLITGGSITRGNTAFETGSLQAIYNPLIATNSPTVLT